MVLHFPAASEAKRETYRDKTVRYPFPFGSVHAQITAQEWLRGFDLPKRVPSVHTQGDSIRRVPLQPSPEETGETRAEIVTNISRYNLLFLPLRTQVGDASGSEQNEGLHAMPGALPREIEAQRRHQHQHVHVRRAHPSPRRVNHHSVQ